MSFFNKRKFKNNFFPSEEVILGNSHFSEFVEILINLPIKNQLEKIFFTKESFGSSKFGGIIQLS